MSRMVGSIPAPSLWAAISTAVVWDGGLGTASGDLLPLRKAKQPAKSFENQTNVRSAGRQTMAITTPLNIALTSGLEPSTQYQSTRNVEAFPQSFYDIVA